MFHLTLILADTVLIATSTDGNLWDVTCKSMFDGSEGKGQWTNEQLLAVQVLAHGAGEEKYNGYHIEYLYAMCEPLFKDWPKNARCIP